LQKGIFGVAFGILDSKKGEKMPIFYPARKNELRMQTRAMFIFQNLQKIFYLFFKYLYNILLSNINNYKIYCVKKFQNFAQKFQNFVQKFQNFSQLCLFHSQTAFFRNNIFSSIFLILNKIIQ
jgi:hypothetical protein